MDVTKFVLSIIFGTFFFVGFIIWMKMKSDALKLKAGGLSDEAMAELKDLRERVQTLERIATVGFQC